MLERCTNSRHVAFDQYGGRGITVCERWFTFTNFVEDMGIRPKGHSIDRIDNNDGYHPGNCVWSNWTEQGHNRRNVKLTEVMVHQIRDLYARGVFNQTQLAKRFNVKPNTVSLIINHKRWKSDT